MSDYDFSRPVPRPALAKRIKDGDLEIYGIVHWGLNTYTGREWGFGDEDPSMLNPDAFNAEQIVRACKDGGLGGLIVVAKHHDGFCLWPTKTTEHNITKSPFRGGNGDYVREMADACRRNGLKFGVYVSPWDRNSAVYATPEYVKLYREQIRELLGGDYGDVFEMWFDGANGGDGYYGGARETRKIPAGYYGFDEIFAMVRSLQPNVCIFNEADGADFRWPGNEGGFLDHDSRATVRSYDSASYWSYCNVGDKNGTTFHPCEADFPLRKGWFYRDSEDVTTRNPLFLMNRYLLTVGNGGTMNIGIAPDTHGLVCENDVHSLAEFKKIKDLFFSNEVKEGEFNVIVMAEDVTNGEHVDGWEFIADGVKVASGASIGMKRIRILDKPVKAFKCEVKVTESQGEVGKIDFKLYRVDEKLIEGIKIAESLNIETDTAKWMMAGKAPDEDSREVVDDNGLSWNVYTEPTKWLNTDFMCYSVKVDGLDTMIVAPHKARKGNPWVWCTEWPTAFPERTGTIAALEDGFYFVHIAVGTDCNGSPECIEHMDAFYRYLVGRGLDRKCIVTGVSRGGFYAWRFASKFPSRVYGIYGDAPCCDFKSYPTYVMPSSERGFDRGQYDLICSLYGFNAYEEFAAFHGNPVDYEILKPIADAGIPALHVVGDADEVVPPEYNTNILARHFEMLGGKISVIRKPGCGHHPHGLEDPTPILAFFQSASCCK